MIFTWWGRITANKQLIKESADPPSYNHYTIVLEECGVEAK